MSRHPGADELMAQRFVDGLLTGPELAAAEQRLARDASFQDLVARLQGVGNWFAHRDEEVAAPAGFANRVAFAARTGKSTEDRCTNLVDRLAWAAALLILLGLSGIAGVRLARTDRTLRAEGDQENRFQELLLDARRNEPARRLIVPAGGGARRETGPRERIGGK